MLTHIIISALLAANINPVFDNGNVEPDRVCTIGGVAVPQGERLPETIPTVMSCFDDMQAAQEFIASGAPGDAERLMRRQARAVAAATVTIGKVWTGTSRSGSVLIHWGVGSGCNGVTYGFPSLPAGWNDTIRSAEGFTNCWASHYDSASYTGAVLTCAPYCATMGSLAGRSSSIVYRPVGTFG